MTPPVVAFVGRSGTGKTTLLVKVIAELTRRGIRVGSVKHSHHMTAVKMDVEGKDSWRHKQAGAVRTLLVGPGHVQLVADREEEVSPAVLASRYMEGLDLVLLEGFKESPGEKIEVLRAERSSEPMLASGDGRVALVSDLGLDLGVPRFELDDVAGIADFLIGRYLK